VATEPGTRKHLANRSARSEGATRRENAQRLRSAAKGSDKALKMDQNKRDFGRTFTKGNRGPKSGQEKGRVLREPMRQAESKCKEKRTYEMFTGWGKGQGVGGREEEAANSQPQDGKSEPKAKI